jgi:hypothetical protein
MQEKQGFLLATSSPNCYIFYSNNYKPFCLTFKVSFFTALRLRFTNNPFPKILFLYLVQFSPWLFG